VSGQNFELGILNNDNAFEVDIDKVISRKLYLYSQYFFKEDFYLLGNCPKN